MVESTDRPLDILMGIIFYPRGGSAQVVRYLSYALRNLGHRVHVVTGSLHDGDPQHDARVFYSGLPVTEADYTEAWRGFREGHDPISPRWEIPFHPSYEDKRDVPDRVFYRVSKTEYAALLASWRGLFARVKEQFEPDIVHLHHLNHSHLAAAEVFAGSSRVTQLHGTELKMLERLDALGESDVGRSPAVRTAWHGRLTEAVQSVHHSFAISPDVRNRALAQLGVTERDVTTVPNGVDLSLFRRLDWPDDERLRYLRKILVEAPRGWDESGVPGSVNYTDRDLRTLTDEMGRLKPLAMFVGRFLDFKRVPLLIEAVARLGNSFNLLVWGGMPGEWEGRHPIQVTRDLGLSNVFFSGWLPHAMLSKGLNLADVFVAPSYYEPFGQVYLEAMATGVPVIATRSGGPLEFVVESGPQANGWLCAVDSVESLAETMLAALSSGEERQRRGANALDLVRSEYDWGAIAQRYVRAYRRLVEGGRPEPST